MEKQQIDKEFISTNFKIILGTDKSKTSPKLKQKLPNLPGLDKPEPGRTAKGLDIAAQAAKKTPVKSKKKTGFPFVKVTAIIYTFMKLNPFL